MAQKKSTEETRITMRRVGVCGASSDEADARRDGSRKSECMKM